MFRSQLLFSLFLLMSFATFAQTNFYMAVQTKVEHGLIEGNYDIRTGMQITSGLALKMVVIRVVPLRPDPTIK